MLKITRVGLPKAWEEYLKKRRLYKQFKKASTYICQWNPGAVWLKLRRPKKDGVYYFRINKQFRARAKIVGNTLIVFYIDNHQ